MPIDNKMHQQCIKLKFEFEMNHLIFLDAEDEIRSLLIKVIKKENLGVFRILMNDGKKLL